MKEQGFELTAGKRRAFSFVDETGKIHSLSRHINQVIDKEQNPKWRSDMKVCLADTELDDAQFISDQKKKKWLEQQYFDRDKHHTEWQGKVDQAANYQELDIIRDFPQQEPVQALVGDCQPMMSLFNYFISMLQTRKAITMI